MEAAKRPQFEAAEDEDAQFSWGSPRHPRPYYRYNRAATHTWEPDF